MEVITIKEKKKEKEKDPFFYLIFKRGMIVRTKSQDFLAVFILY